VLIWLCEVVVHRTAQSGSDYLPFDAVASLGAGGAGRPLRVTPSMGVTPEGKTLWTNLHLQRIVEK